jgi:hypothetical protein
MTPLVLQLQADSLDNSSRISDLLRKTKVVAMKLGLEDVKEWVDRELHGFRSDFDIPEYRKLNGKVKFFNQHHGWRPVIFKDREMEEMLSECIIYQSVASIEDSLERSRESGYLCYPIPGGAQAILSRMIGMIGVTEFQIHINPSMIVNILDGIRNRILDWSCSLEKAGIVGEGLSFSTKEKEAAVAMSSGNIYHIQGNVGVLGHVNHSTVTTNQITNYNADQLDALRDTIEQIEAAVGQLSSDIKPPVAAAVVDIKSELQKAQPDSGKIRKAITSLRTTCEGAAGNLIASGIVGLIAKFLG